MDIRGQERTDVVHRLHRARGQIDGVLAMIEAGRSCEDVATQLAAASAALDRAALKVLTFSIRECYLDGRASSPTVAEQLERFMPIDGD